MASVLTLGSATVDFVFHVSKFPQSAEKYRADGSSVVGGGCAANAAVAISRLGGHAILAACVGDDPQADLILNELAHHHVDTSLVRRFRDGRTSCSSVLLDSMGERMIVNDRGHGLRPTPDWLLPASLINAVLVDSRWPEGAHVALEMARIRKIPGIVDVEAGVDPVLLQLATHLAFSAQGLGGLLPGRPLDEALREIAVKYDAWACVTDGGNDVLYTADQKIGRIAAFKVPVVDTLGAGDVWHGAFALHLAQGNKEQAAIRFANAAAALKCTGSGARAAIPDAKAIKSFLEENQECN